MKRLDKVLEIWRDLEETYTQFKQKDEKLTKIEFLKSILGYSDSKSSPTALKSLLMSEVDSYSPKEYQDYESLLEVLDDTYEKLSGKSSDIVDLDEFVYNLKAAHFSLDNYNCFGGSDHRIAIGDAIAQGILVDTVCERDGEVASFFLGNEQRDYVAIRNLAEVLEFLRKDSATISADPFLAQVYFILGNYVMKRNLIVPTIFFGSSLFQKSAKELTIGSVHIPITKRNCVLQENVNIKTLQQETITVPKLEYINKKIKKDYGTIQINCVVV